MNRKSLLTTMVAGMFLLLAFATQHAQAQAPPCDIKFPNYIDCNLTMRVVIHCGGNVYCYDGNVGPGTWSMPGVGFLPFNPLCGPPPPICDFSNCKMDVYINGAPVAMGLVPGQKFRYCCGNAPPTAANCAVPNYCQTFVFDPFQGLVTHPGC